MTTPTTRETVKTTKLNNGLTVLSKDGSWPITYVNDTQANRKRDELRAAGIACWVYGAGRPAKYVAIDMAR